MFASIPRTFVVVAFALMAVCNTAAVNNMQTLAKRDNVQQVSKLDCSSANTHCIYISGNGYLGGAEDDGYTPCLAMRSDKGAKACQYPANGKVYAYCAGSQEGTVEVNFSYSYSQFGVSGYAQAQWSSDKRSNYPQYGYDTKEKGDDLYITCSN